MKRLLSISIIFSTSFFFCTFRGNKQTKEFKTYLKEVVGEEPRNGAIYLFVPSNQCKNCVKLDASKLPMAVGSNLYLISSLPEKHFKNFAHYFFDKENKLLELKLVDYRNKFVFYNHNRVEVVTNAEIVDPLIMPAVCESPN